jgi:hypothetical protein
MATFDAELSKRIDVYLAAIDKVNAWPDSRLKRVCLVVLHYRLLQVERAAGL